MHLSVTEHSVAEHEQRTRQGSAHGNLAPLRGPLPLVARRLLFLVVSALALGDFGTADLGRRERRVTHFGIGKSILPGGVKRNFWPFRILRVLLLPATGVLVVEEGGSTGHLDHMGKVAAKARRQSVDQKARAMDKEAEQEALEAGKLQSRTLERRES